MPHKSAQSSELSGWLALESMEANHGFSDHKKSIGVTSLISNGS